VKTALIQMTSGSDPKANLATATAMMRDAVAQGATFLLTPEVTNCISMRRAEMEDVLQHEEGDDTLAGLRAEAAALGIWLSIGSLALKTDDPDGRFANRSFMINPSGDIVARYDKMHMFDVQVSDTETYQESKGYRPGSQSVLAETSFGKVGMTICYDVRFPHMHRDLAKAGADILLVPAAFSPVTGAAHWETLLRARAIETGCFVLAAAQTGQHSAKRATYGHSLAVSPWGAVLHDAGTEPGVSIIDIDLAEVSKARQRIPALTHDRAYEGPACLKEPKT